MSATLDHLDRQLKDSLSTALVTAIANDDNDMIASLRGAGADAGHAIDFSDLQSLEHMSARERKQTFASPIAFAIRSGKPDLVPHLIGPGATAVPQGAVVDGKLLSLFEMLATEEGIGYLPVTLPDLSSSVDLSAPSVAHAWWDMALRTLKPKPGNTHPDFTQTNVALSILDYGGVPHNGAEGVLTLLNTEIVYKNALEVAFHPFVDSLACSIFAGGIVKRMLGEGLSPDARISGIPLLHYAAMTNSVSMTNALIEAGADARATCEWTVLQHYLSSNVSPRDPSITMATAADTADVFGSDVAHLLRSTLAKSAIMNIARAGARSAP